MDRKLTVKKSLGLQQRPTYEDLVKYIEKDPDTIRYPNRTAKIARNSFELSQLDGIGQLEINRQHELGIINQERQLMLQQFARDHNLPLADVRAYLDNMGLVPERANMPRQQPAAAPPGPAGPAGPAGPPGPPGRDGRDGMQSVGLGGQLGPVEEPAQPADVQINNLGGVVINPPPPLRNPRRSTQPGMHRGTGGIPTFTQPPNLREADESPENLRLSLIHI
jgi:hypothetical protein